MKPLLISLACALLLGAMMNLPRASSGPDEALAEPSYNDAFWQRWGDGHAELSGYELEYSRYGQQRAGTAVTIFCSETFSSAARVKADPGRHPASDEFPVIKLNLIQDFPTGLYDYNMMTSAFVALAPVHGRVSGTATKVSFSAQEWCGHAYHQVLFDREGARFATHSYFDGEGDQGGVLPYPQDGVAEDALLLWARGLAAPALAPGERRTVKVLRSLEFARLRHVAVEWEAATLSRGKDRKTIEAPMGKVEVESWSAELPGRSWTFEVEAAAPHRVIEWRSSQGHRARLIASARLKYWELNGPGGEAALAKLGLKARPPRTP